MTVIRLRCGGDLPTRVSMSIGGMVRNWVEGRPLTIVDIGMHKDPAIARLYQSARWKKLRKMVLKRQPVCRICHRDIATVVDHIQPHKGDESLFWMISNLQGLCKPCHDRDKRRMEFGHAIKTIGVDGWEATSNSVMHRGIGG
jgi:hypothetical protein